MGLDTKHILTAKSLTDHCFNEDIFLSRQVIFIFTHYSAMVNPTKRSWRKNNKEYWTDTQDNALFVIYLCFEWASQRVLGV